MEKRKWRMLLKGLAQRYAKEAEQLGVEEGSEEHMEVFRQKEIARRKAEALTTMKVSFLPAILEVSLQGRRLGDLIRTEKAWTFHPADWFVDIPGSWASVLQAQDAVQNSKPVKDFASYLFKNSKRKKPKKSTYRKTSTPPEDFVGKTFGDRTVLEYLEQRRPGVHIFRTVCSCGRKEITQSSTLKKKLRCRHERIAAPATHIGKTFGDRLVLEALREAEAPRFEARYKVKCVVCGKMETVTWPALRRNTRCRHAQKPPVGATLGYRTILAYTKDGRVRARCACEKEQIILLRSLRKHTSCGCKADRS